MTFIHEVACSSGGLSRAERKALNEALATAAASGDLTALGRCKAAGATNLDEAMTIAASNGHLALVKELRAWGATDFQWAITSAAAGGQLEAVVELSSGSKIDFDIVLAYAAEKGHVLIMNELYPRVARFETAFAWAAAAGNKIAAALCRTWGAENLGEAAVAARTNGHGELAAEIASWE